MYQRAGSASIARSCPEVSRMEGASVARSCSGVVREGAAVSCTGESLLSSAIFMGACRGACFGGLGSSIAAGVPAAILFVSN